MANLDNDQNDAPVVDGSDAGTIDYVQAEAARNHAADVAASN